MDASRRQAGASLIEVAVVVAVIGVIAAAAYPQMGVWVTNLRVKAAAREAANTFLLARSEAIRTGTNHIVFFGPPGTTDPGGNAIEDDAGNSVPLLILSDDDADCVIDGGEATDTVNPETNVSWGVTKATAAAPNDIGAASYTTGSSFADVSNNAIQWVLFRPDGVPVSFTGTGGDCNTIAGTGSGGGALYVTNTNLDYAVVLTPLGGVRVHGLAAAGSNWTN